MSDSEIHSEIDSKIIENELELLQYNFELQYISLNSDSKKIGIQKQEELRPSNPMSNRFVFEDQDQLKTSGKRQRNLEDNYIEKNQSQMKLKHELAVFHRSKTLNNFNLLNNCSDTSEFIIEQLKEEIIDLTSFNLLTIKDNSNMKDYTK